MARRDAGIPFDFAWGVALAEVRWPADVHEAAQWRAALTWAESEFRDAYEHPAARPAFAARALAGREALAALAGVEGPLRILGAPVHT